MSTNAAEPKEQAPTTAAADNAGNKATPLASQKPDYKPFDTDTLYSLMVAELAASRQQYATTLSNYLAEAKKTEDLGIIKRAARFAQYFRIYDQTLDMGKLWLKQEPLNIEAHAIVASAYIENRLPLQALDHAEVILSLLDPSDKESAKKAAIAETIANFSRDADTLTVQTLTERYSDLARRYPTYPAILVGLSSLYSSQNDTAKAYEAVTQAQLIDQDYLPAVMQEIQLLQASQQVDKATAKLAVQLEKNPENLRLRLLYARLLTQTDIETAYAQFTKLSNDLPKHLDIKFSRALIALEVEQHDIAVELLNELLAVQYRPNVVRFYLGNLAELNSQYQQALNFYLAVDAGEDFISAHTRAARIMAKEDNVDKAQEHFQQLRDNSPKKRVELYTAEANILEHLNHTERALGILSKAADEFPDNVSVRYNRSNLYEKTNQLELMESDLRHILTLEPDNASALNALGYFLTNRTERHKEALALIQKAMALKPDDPAIMDSMGWALFNLKRNEEAIEYLRKAFELFPDPEVAAHLGEALWVKGNKQEARSIWSNNLKENPNDIRIINTMERLQVNQ
ncbi:MAG: tetratricopeptide repeat protein [Pseudomonadota bacterium]